MEPRDRLITGFRVGYAVFPAEHVDAAKTRHILVNVAGSRPARHAALRALRETGPGFYVPARFEGLPGTMANATALIEEAGVAAMPGETFGRTRADRFRFAPCTPRIEVAGERLAAYLG